MKWLFKRERRRRFSVTVSGLRVFNFHLMMIKQVIEIDASGFEDAVAQVREYLNEKHRGWHFSPDIKSVRWIGASTS